MAVGHYGFGYVLCAKALQLTKGKSDGTFGPDDDLTRAQMAAFLVRLWRDVLLRECPSAPAHSFGDVSGSFAEDDISCIAALEVTKGVSPGVYGPDMPVRTAQITLFVARLLNKVDAGTCDLDANELESAATCLTALRIAPDTAEAKSGVTASRAQMAVYLIGAWHHASGRGQLPYPPRRLPYGVGDIRDMSPVLKVELSQRKPIAGEEVDIIVTATDETGVPLFGAELQLTIDNDVYDTVTVDRRGRARFSYRGPFGPANEGGYDSLQVILSATDAASRPLGVFWQSPDSRQILLEVSPDRPHSSTAKNLVATVKDGQEALAGKRVVLVVDGRSVGQATTDDAGTAKFVRTRALEGPFDLATVHLQEDSRVKSNEVLFSWPISLIGSATDNHWSLIWSDEFDGDSLDTSKWRASNNCPPVYLACETDRLANVEVVDGRLHLRSLRERYIGTNNWKGAGDQFGPLTVYTPGVHQVKDFTGARIDTRTTQSFTYGRFEMLAKLPQGHGTFFGYWLKPLKSPYGSGVSGGEMDIAEGVNIGVGGVDGQHPGPGWLVHSVVHMGYPFKNPHVLTNLPVNPAAAFHHYAAEWDTASIRYYIDGKRVFSLPRSRWFSHPKDADEPLSNPYAPFDVPFIIAIHNQVGNWALQTWPNHEVPDTTVFPTDFVVDYVRVFECRPPPGDGDLGPGQGCEAH